MKKLCTNKKFFGFLLVGKVQTVWNVARKCKSYQVRVIFWEFSVFRSEYSTHYSTHITEQCLEQLELRLTRMIWKNYWLKKLALKFSISLTADHCRSRDQLVVNYILFDRSLLHNKSLRCQSYQNQMYFSAIPLHSRWPNSKNCDFKKKLNCINKPFLQPYTILTERLKDLIFRVYF